MKGILRKGLVYALIPVAVLTSYIGGRVQQQSLDQVAARDVAGGNYELGVSEGALRAAKEMAKRSPGIYTLADKLYSELSSYGSIDARLNRIKSIQGYDFIYDRLSGIIEGLRSPKKEVRVAAEEYLRKTIRVFWDSHSSKIKDATEVLPTQFVKPEEERVRDLLNRIISAELSKSQLIE